MLATIEHRGPDGEGFWHAGQVGLGHRRLTILDTSDLASQPMLTRDGMGVLVYNGETYNYRQLRQELEAEGCTFRSSGDTAVVLCALHHWGPEKCIPRLNGMFALAYLDRRDATLWLARDRLGIKTLVTADTGGAILFASEAKALLAHPHMKPRVDRMALTKWIVRRPRHAHRLLFESVQPIDAGSWWKVTARGIEKHCYFSALEELDVDRLIAGQGEEIAQLVNETERLISQSVELHLASDVPLASICSGGVDSSLITAYAKERLPNIRAYVADIDFPRSEAMQAERVGRHLGVPVRRVGVNRERYLRLWAEAVWHSDGPPTHISDPALLAVTRTCQGDGIKVLLTGEGSDELFGGYAQHAAPWRRLRRLEGPLAILPGVRRRARQFSESYVPFHHNPGTAFERRHSLATDADDNFMRYRVMDRLGPVEPLSDRAFLACGLVDLYGYLTTLLHRHDRLGMAASIEMRVPFIENRVIDFAIHLPRTAKLHRRQGKRVLKEAAVRRLPTDIVYARKKGFPVPFEFVHGTSRLLLGGRLADEFGWSRRVTEAIVTILESDSYLCFATVGLEMWLRIYFAEEEPEALGERLVALAA